MVHAAALGSDQHWLGRRIDMKAAVELKRLSERYGLNVCGEGGEYESLVVDAPWFRKRLVIDEGRGGLGGHERHIRRERCSPRPQTT